MLIEFTGPSFVDRSAGPNNEYNWPAKAPKPRTQEVSDPKVIADLLTTRGGEFKIAKGEPLLQLEGMGPKMAANLANAGYASQGALSSLLVADQKALAGTLGVDEGVVRGWVTASKEAVKASAATGGTTGSNIASGPATPASAPTAPPTGGTTTGGLANVTETPRQ